MIDDRTPNKKEVVVVYDFYLPVDVAPLFTIGQVYRT